MPDFAEPLARLIAEVKRLPGIGQKSAQRIAFHLLRTPREDVDRLAAALVDVKEKLGLCSVCGNISEASCAPIATIRTATAARSAWWKRRPTSCRSRRRARSTACTTCCTAPSARCAAWARSSCRSRNC